MSKGKDLSLSYEVEIEVRDKDGKLISFQRIKKGGWLKNLLLFMRAVWAGAGESINIKDTGGVNRLFPAWYNTYLVNQMLLSEGAGSADFGIHIGSGTTAVTRDDFQLATKMGHGTGSGQFSYGAVTVETVNGTPPQTRVRIIRTFTNNYTSTQTVYEIGMVVRNMYATTAYWYFMVARDVLTTPSAVPVGATLTVRYIVTVTA